jgi:hypothetical protein
MINDTITFTDRAYDFIIAYADQFAFTVDPCMWEDGKCIAGRLGYYQGKSCCRSCEYLEYVENLDATMCTTRNASCKLFYCDIAQGYMTDYEKNLLNQMQEYAHVLGIATDNYYVREEDEKELIHQSLKNQRS